MASGCHVICFGNALHGDDGFGAAVHARLAAQPLPAGVRLYRADTAGVSALPLFEDCARVVLVDAVQGFGAPGSLHCLPAEAIAVEAGESGHGFGVGGVLAMARATLGALPPLRLVGVEAADMKAFRPALSAPVACSLPDAVELVKRTVQHEFA